MATPDDKFRVTPEGSPIYGAVGLIVSNWGRLERTVDEAIWELLQTDPTLSAAVTAHLNGLPSRFAALKALMRRWGIGEAELEKVRKLDNRSNEIRDRRNRLAHDPMFVHVITGQHVQYTSTVTKNSGRQILDFVPIDEDDLLDLARRIHKFDEEVWTTLDEILALLRVQHTKWLMVARSVE